MNSLRQTLSRSLFAFATALALGVPATASAQDALARAKQLYAAAEYEGALQALETLKGTSPNTEVSAYEMYCLVALNRRDEARAVAEIIVRTDPFYRLSEAAVSPRIVSLFNAVRQPLLVDVARGVYERAKSAFERRDWAPAVRDFDRALTLLNEISGPAQGAADLRTLTEGFRDLARAALTPPVTPTPIPTGVAPPPQRPVEPRGYGPEDLDVVAAVPVSAPLPPWRPAFLELNQTFAGEIELLISESGKVLSVTLVTSVHPRYDPPLLEAARKWTFTPATKDGVAVRYRYPMPVRVLK